jgi:hypothetical protein
MLFIVDNLNINLLVSLPYDYYRRCYPVFEAYTLVVGGGAIIKDQNLFSSDTTNFLLLIPFASDSSHME